MEVIADLHLHSKYSRAVSSRMVVEEMARWAEKKGIDLVGTADWTHPLWLKELEVKLEEAAPGLYRLRKAGSPRKSPYFLLATEIASIYSQGGKTRRIHNLVLAPSFETVKKINAELNRRGVNLFSDGRPITGISARDLVALILEIDENCLVVSCHAWTPWFSLYGSKSGFDSIKECYQDMSDYIDAIETGLSSSPAMNWRIEELDSRSIVSFSDAHCVHPDSLIYLARGGITKIKSLNKDEKPLSLDFKNDLRLKPSLVGKIHRLPAPSYLYQIKTRSWELLATPNHRFFVLGNEKIKEKQAFQLKIDDLIACVRKTKMGKKKAVYLSTPKFRQRIKISQKGLSFLKKRRLELGYSARDVSFKLGKNKDFIWMVETRRIKSLRLEEFEKMCRLCKIKSKEFCQKFKTRIFPKIKTPQYTNKDFCQFLGYALGDGGVERSKGEKWAFSLTDKDKDLLSFYQALTGDLFGIKGKFKKSKSQRSYRLYFPFNLLLFLEHTAPGIFDYSNKRKVPQIAFKVPKHQLATFLRGFYDAEGTFDHHGLSLCSSSKALIKQIQYLLLKFGILSFIYSDFEKNKRKYRYKLIIYGQDLLEIFSKKIGFKSSEKRHKVLNYLSHLRQKPKDSFKDPLPLKKTVSQLMRNLHIEPKDLPKNLQNFYYKNFKGLKRRNVKEFIEVFKNYHPEGKERKLYWDLKRFAESDICWEAVKDLRRVKADCKFVYDLTIPHFENYVVNGVITHNSPEKMGREATVFRKSRTGSKSNTGRKGISYDDIVGAIKGQGEWEIAYTIEFYPEEGKYHYTGHRNCGVRQSPEETKKLGATCPVCGKPLTVGVMHRVEQLAKREINPPSASGGGGEKLKIKNDEFESKWISYEDRPPYVMLVPLVEVIAEAQGSTPHSQKVMGEYERLMAQFGSEFEVLLKTEIKKIAAVSGGRVAEGIRKVRQGDLEIKPGYDGVFGEVKIWPSSDPSDGTTDGKQKQMSLF